MVASTVIHQFADSGVRLRIDDETVTLDISGDPNHPNPIKVKELAISYKTTSDGSEITNLVYVLDDVDRPVAYVHPDHLDRPEEWPAGVRELVDQHRPNNTSSTILKRQDTAELARLRTELEDQRKAKQIAAGAADRFRDVLSEALGHEDENPGDDTLIAELRAHFGRTGPEPTRWRDFLTGAEAIRDQINAAHRQEAP